MEAVASQTASSLASATMGSAISSAAEKGVEPVKNDKLPESTKIGIKVSEVILSSIMTSLAITLFGRMSKKIKGSMAFVTLALAVSIACALITAYIKIALG